MDGTHLHGAAVLRNGGELELNAVSSACWCRATCGAEDLTTPRSCSTARVAMNSIQMVNITM
jgi:hypothetical protein